MKTSFKQDVYVDHITFKANGLRLGAIGTPVYSSKSNL